MKPTEDSGVQLQEILNLCREMNAERDVQALMLLIAKEGARLMEAERVTVFLFDEEHRQLRSQVTLDNEIIRLDARLGIVSEAARTGELINIPDAHQDDRFYSAVDERTGFRTRSVLALPLRLPSGEIIGVFEALNKKGGHFQAADEDIARTLAEQVALAISNASTVQALEKQQDQLLAENTQLLRALEQRFATRNLIGSSEPVQHIIRQVDIIRDRDVDVLITGESGTGKELVAKALHYDSSRAQEPFVALNCGALPENLVESELFGHVKGAFTGATNDKAGLFESAKRGTIFLDEIGEMPWQTQVRLLRVLNERTFRKVGGNQDIKMDARVIAATNADLEKAVAEKAFRADLYYRLKVVTIHTPALRDIQKDIALLAQHLLKKHCRKGEQRKLTSGALKCLSHYSWPGNVRELENEMRRVVAWTRKTTIGEEDLSETIRTASKVPGGSRLPMGQQLKKAVEELEVRLISDALRHSRGNQLQAAKALGLSRQGLIKKVKRYRLKTG